MQSRFISFVESVVNVAIGSLVAYGSAIVIYPLVGMTASYGTYFEVTIYFTIVSVIRMYALRRWFNGPFHVWLMKRNANKN